MPTLVTPDRTQIDTTILPDVSPTATAALIHFLMDHEGLVLEPYLDSAGHWTIGFGHKILGTYDDAAHQYLMWTEAEARHHLYLDIQKAAHAARVIMGASRWTALPDLVKAGCVEFVYNLGPAGFRKFKIFRRALAARDWPRARSASKRYYRDAATGEWRPLSRRNEAFINTFLPETIFHAQPVLPRYFKLAPADQGRIRQLSEKEAEEAIEGSDQQPQPASTAPGAGHRDEAGVEPVAPVRNKGGSSMFKNLLRAIFGGLAKATEDGDLTRDEVEDVLHETAFEAAWNPIRRQIVDLSDRLSPPDARILGEELIEIGEDVMDNAGNR